MPDQPSKLCFVIGPIGKPGSEHRVHADWLLHGIIKPVIASIPEFRVKRADEDPRPGLIDAQMINDLLTADLVIADLSFLNPNAFYEIGIRHMVQKPIIHMQLEGEQIPFDVSLYRAVPFSRAQYQHVEEAKVALGRAVEAVLAPGYVVENPVTNTRGQIHLREHATPELRVLSDQMEALQQRMGALELAAEVQRASIPIGLWQPTTGPTTFGSLTATEPVLGHRPARGALAEALANGAIAEALRRGYKVKEPEPAPPTVTTPSELTQAKPKPGST